MLERDVAMSGTSRDEAITTVVGSAAAIVSAVGVTAMVSAAPIAGAVLGVVGAGVAAGALYHKLAEKQKHDKELQAK